MGKHEQNDAKWGVSYGGTPSDHLFSWGFSRFSLINGGFSWDFHFKWAVTSKCWYLNSWMVDSMESPTHPDDDSGYIHFRNPPMMMDKRKNRSLLCIIVFIVDCRCLLMLLQL